MDPLPASTSTCNSAISDLDDDCLLEVFQHLHWPELYSVADVCRRFRRNAQSHFASSKPNNVLVIGDKFVYLQKNERYLRNRVSQKLLVVSTTLRNFGFSLKAMMVTGDIAMAANTPTQTQFESEKYIFDLINLHCTASLNELSLERCDITKETENKLRPLFLRLHRLKLLQCSFTKRFGQMLSLWTPEIREMKLARYHGPGNDSWFHKMRIGDILRPVIP